MMNAASRRNATSSLSQTANDAERYRKRTQSPALAVSIGHSWDVNIIRECTEHECRMLVVTVRGTLVEKNAYSALACVPVCESIFWPCHPSTKIMLKIPQIGK